MNCLKCGEKMKKKALAGVLVDHCVNCLGVWLDRNEFEIAVSTNSTLTRADLRKLADTETTAEVFKMIQYKGLCGRCGSQVSEIDFHGIRVDKCSGCKGMYFEYGELVKCLQQCKSKDGWIKKLLSLMR